MAKSFVLMATVYVVAAVLVVLGGRGVAPVDAQVDADQITYLPFLNGTLWPQWSGYAVVNETHGRALHYWFVQSQSNDPSSDPVVLWLNGGPGCSSLDGLLYENGPYSWSPGVDISLRDNPNAWNQVANIIYLESPAGVGFSYSNTSSDYDHPSDWQTAKDNLAFLNWFFTTYTDFAGNDFWIAGESYAGTYIPTLAKLLVDTQFDLANFQGIMVGNGITDEIYDGPFVSLLPFMYGHALIGKNTWDQIQSACYPDNTTTQCNDLVNATYSVFNYIDIYNIIGQCFTQRPSMIPFFDSGSSSGSGENIIPCTDATKGFEYLNDAYVKAAIHVRPDIEWQICSNEIFFNYDSNAGSMLKIYPELIKANLNILVYSGDVDARVPFTGTEAWVASLGQPVLDYWAPWYYNDNEGQQTGGFKTTYDGITFITIRGAGHMVPQFAPEAAFAFFSRFLAGNPI